MAKFMETDIPVLIDKNKSRRTLHSICPHRQWHALRLAVISVNTNRKAQPVLVHEYFKRIAAHHRVMFEDGMQANDCYTIGIKFLVDSLRLRNPHLHATRTENLEGMQHNYFAP